MSKYPSLNEQIKEFGVHWIVNGELELLKTIKSKEDYSHSILVIHHYIKEQQYYRYPERYQGKQKLILMPKELHKDIHSAMSDDRFFKKWKIERKKLLYRNRILNEVQDEN